MNFNKLLFGLIAFITSVLFTLVDGMMIEEILSIGIFVYFLLDFIDLMLRRMRNLATCVFTRTEVPGGSA